MDDSVYDVKNDNSSMMTDQDKTISLFKYIEELGRLKQKVIMNINDYSWSFSVRSIPDDPKNISIYYRDRVEDEHVDSNTTLLSVCKPEFQRCPEPDTAFAEWLYEGWASFRNEVLVNETIEREANEKQTIVEKLQSSIGSNSMLDGSSDEEAIGDTKKDVLIEHFTDDEERVKAYEKWLIIRNEWVDKQKRIDQTRKFFTRLYQIHVDLERESETLELVVSNGFLCDRDNRDINHPLITRRVKTNFDPITNTMSIEDTDVITDLYMVLLQNVTDINLNSITSIRDDLYKNDYHPMDRNDTPEFLKVLIHQLSPDSAFSEDGEPKAWYQGNRLMLYWDPTFIIRKRVDGTIKAVEQIIENIEKTGDVPPHLVNIVSGGKIDIPEDDNEETVEEQLANVGGESIDILLSKEANKEQLEIAKRIERYNAVLVQGPPGTGKTHTIANLMGHFLAHGKSVLVTSHTKKALSVLKENVNPGLQNLCVSVIDDTNEDMERSIDGITDYMSKYTSHELKRQMERAASERLQITSDLARIRKKLFTIINRECNSIILNGEEISPSKAASFVLDHAEDLSYIPGNVRLHTSLPLTFSELTDLYRSNEEISIQDEPELACDIPKPELLLSPLKFGKTWRALVDAKRYLSSVGETKGWVIQSDFQKGNILFKTDFGEFNVNCTSEEDYNSLSSYIESFGNIQTWMKYAAVDGKKGGSFRQRWITLIDQIQKACDYAETVVSEQFGKDIKIISEGNNEDLVSSITKLKKHFAKKGKVTKLDVLINNSFEKALSAVTINGDPVQTSNDCEIVLHNIELIKIRNQCAIYWNELLSAHDVPSFFDLDAKEPERIAKNWIQSIHRYLDWYQIEYSLLAEYLSDANIPAEIVFLANVLDSELSATDKILSAISSIIPFVLDVCKTVFKIQGLVKIIEDSKYILEEGTRIHSAICKQAFQAMSDGDTLAYTEAFNQIEVLYQKYDLLKKRDELIKKITPSAPQWAEAILKREGIHGTFTVPSTIEDAWRWKQYSGIIADITAESYDELLASSNSLSKRYREITAEYAEKSAWYHLLRRSEHDIDMKQALNGWKMTVKRIGKGTGKNAPMYKAKARELMAKCQTAVPGWIMPINRALENLDPKSNRFDVIIIDEASQSDICALAITYMAKKLIVVGDDKQVSPMAIGTEIDKINALMQMYIKNKIPNAHLYRPDTSLYDAAAMTFQPLMLREHFRCVPEIIGFSNSLSYDFKIKPLRDGSNCQIVPSVVNYRVEGGERDDNRKENLKEAKTIVSLIMACIEQPEYYGKTFGVISLLGDEQAKRIQTLIFERIDPQIIESRKLLSGNASNFQGDQRDVIFLSIVDSNPGPGSLRLLDYGSNDAYRKRYNVATSRARDQLWVVHSLDAANDLKPGDLRKRLIEYALNPTAVDTNYEEIEKKSESPFEMAVAKALASRGYHLVQQWKVGAYRLDMVATCGNKKVAIECDGERYHSSEAKIREDMERQTILERIGWRFIRIRGSEYYRNPEKTMDRVIDELRKFEIEPEEQSLRTTELRTSELLQRVKTRAEEILRSFNTSIPYEPDIKTIEFALSAQQKKESTNIKNNQDKKSLELLNPPLSMPNNNNLKLTNKTEDKGIPDLVEQQNKKIDNILKQMPESINTMVYHNFDKHASKKNLAEIKGETRPLHQPSHSTTHEKHKQMTIDEVLISSETPNDVISLIRAKGVEFIDNRSNHGALWIVGGHELSTLVSDCRKLGVYFKFKPGGGKTTKGRDSWWAK